MIQLYENTYLSADDKQFIMFNIKNIKKSKKGKTEGKEYESNHSYFPSLELLFNKLFSNMIIQEIKKEELDTFEKLKTRYMKLSLHVKHISSKIGTTKNLLEKMKSKEVEQTDE